MLLLLLFMSVTDDEQQKHETDKNGLQRASFCILIFSFFVTDMFMRPLLPLIWLELGALCSTADLTKSRNDNMTCSGYFMVQPQNQIRVLTAGFWEYSKMPAPEVRERIWAMETAIKTCHEWRKVCFFRDGKARRQRENKQWRQKQEMQLSEPWASQTVVALNVRCAKGLWTFTTRKWEQPIIHPSEVQQVIFFRSWKHPT